MSGQRHKHSRLDTGAGHTHSLPLPASRKHKAASRAAIRGVALLTLDISLTPQRQHQRSRWGLRPRKGNRVPPFTNSIPGQTSLPQLPRHGSPHCVLSLTWTSEGPAPGNRCTSTHFLHES